MPGGPRDFNRGDWGTLVAVLCAIFILGYSWGREVGRAEAFQYTAQVTGWDVWQLPPKDGGIRRPWWLLR